MPDEIFRSVLLILVISCLFVVYISNVSNVSNVSTTRENFRRWRSYFQGPYSYGRRMYEWPYIGGRCGCHYASGYIRAHRGKCYNAWGPTVGQPKE